jgi:hypothetical protein
MSCGGTDGGGGGETQAQLPPIGSSGLSSSSAGSHSDVNASAVAALNEFTWETQGQRDALHMHQFRFDKIAGQKNRTVWISECSDAELRAADVEAFFSKLDPRGIMNLVPLRRAHVLIRGLLKSAGKLYCPFLFFRLPRGFSNPPPYTLAFLLPLTPLHACLLSIFFLS